MLKAMRRRVVVAVMLLSALLLTINYFRPIPAVPAAASIPASLTLGGTAPNLPWPTTGSAAVAVSGLGLLATEGGDQPIPTASIAKVMTALIVLIDKPLKPGEQGPTVAITEQDVQVYQADKADEQSVVDVQAGEQLSERKALEAILIPSANNIASTLARWDAGSTDAFVTKMNQRATRLGLAHTKFADPAGALAQTVSTPRDLVSLGMTAMQQR